MKELVSQIEKAIKKRDGMIERLESENKSLRDTLFRMVEQPTLEVAIVEHGEWIREEGFCFPIFRCSKCKTANALGKTKYCPNCGAKMAQE